MEKRVILILGAIFAILTVINQNCSRVSVTDQGVSPQPSTSGQVASVPQPSPTPMPPASIPEFQCKQFVSLTFSNHLQVPARDSSGTCYSVKLLDAVANSASSLTQETDPEVISRNHDEGPTTRNPYVLGQSLVDMILADRRLVKLSGAGDRLTSIKVDNFLLVGIFPQITDNQPSNPQSYRAFGTGDSTSTQDGVLFRQTPVKLQVFGSGGTSTVTALDITSDIQPNAPYTLDLRALDCGGVRELSEIYLLFQ